MRPCRPIDLHRPHPDPRPGTISAATQSLWCRGIRRKDTSEGRSAFSACARGNCKRDKALPALLRHRHLSGLIHRSQPPAAARMSGKRGNTGHAVWHGCPGPSGTIVQRAVHDAALGGTPHSVPPAIGAEGGNGPLHRIAGSERDMIHRAGRAKPTAGQSPETGAGRGQGPAPPPFSTGDRAEKRVQRAVDPVFHHGSVSARCRIGAQIDTDRSHRQPVHLNRNAHGDCGQKAVLHDPSDLGRRVGRGAAGGVPGAAEARLPTK